MVNQNEYKLSPLKIEHVLEIKDFTDQWIGLNYYGIEELESYLNASSDGLLSASFGAWSKGKLQGIRLSLAPGKFTAFISRGLTVSSWPCQSEKMAYFKSLFIAKESQGQGLGSLLSRKSLEILQKMEAEAVLCHSWLESPGNSSQIYLQKFGFKEINQHERYWYPIDYDCTRCAPKRCECTASEMVLDLKRGVSQ